MAVAPVTEEGLSRSYITALLLTANVTSAESAVLESIDSMGPIEASDEALLQNAIIASVGARFRGETSENPDEASMILPLELRSVLR